MREVEVRPVTSENWDDFVRLFEARGSPHYCWCSPYRFRDAHEMSAAQKKANMQRLVAAGTPIGVLAYSGQEPIGWCSIAPRETYVKLGRSRVMPRKTPPQMPTWTVLCFFVARPYRSQGVSRRLLQGAVAWARAQGAEVVEGYPFDTAKITATHHGHSKLFRTTRFRQDSRDRRWSLRLRTG